MQGDDQTGVALVKRWMEKYTCEFPEDLIEAEILEDPGIDLLAAIAGLDAAILVDTLHSGAPTILFDCGLQPLLRDLGVHQFNKEQIN